MSHDTHGGRPELESAPHGELAVPADPDRFPVPDPGMEEHLPRLTDVDERAADRATRQVATMFGLVPLLAVAFVVVYFAVPRDWTIDFGLLHSNAQHVLLGLTLGLAVLLLGMGAIQWARQLMGDEEIVDIRHPMVSTDDARASVMTDVNQGIDETQITRRKVLGRSLIGALAALGLPVIVGLADLGPWPTKKVRAETIERTIWAPGIRLVQDVTFTPIKASDVVIGQLINGQPENLQNYEGTDFLVAEGQGRDHHRPDESEHDQDPRLPPRLAGRRDPLLLQDLHPRRVPDQLVGAADPPPALPVPPVDVRSRQLGCGRLRSRQPSAPPAADHDRRRGVSDRA